MRLHFVGIGGSGISGVAYLATKMGYEVTGCDLEGSTAYNKNIVKGHSPSHIENVDLVVTSPALFFQHDVNPEISLAKKQNKLVTWQEFLGKTLLKDKKVICIAGTHGKSTTTAMAGKLLEDCGFDPIVMVGAFVPQWNGNSRYGKGEYAVIEADEFNNNFLNYSPDIAIINNIEFDHPDFFKDEKEVQESFKKFLANLKGEKIVITEKDSLQKHFNLRILGAHNQKNANMVYLLGKKLGIANDKIIASIESFAGIGRRLELIAERGNVKVYDDYAHHPTAIKATLEALRGEYPKSKILVINEPHGYKRTKALLAIYKGVFDSADKVFIGPIFKARDEIDLSISPELVAKTSGHINALGLNSIEEIIGKWKMENGKYDIVVVMGAGKSYLWAKEIAKLLPAKFSDLTTFKVGGKIEEYIEIKSKDDVPNIISDIKKIGSSIFILGGGSDILASDKEFKGTVIKYIGDSIVINNDGTVTAEAGVGWDKLVEVTVANNYQGMECLSGIPGTVGASPIQNIGAYGQELKDTFVSLEAYDIEKEKFITFNSEDCVFGYRNSIFKEKTHWQKYLIVSVNFKLVKEGKPEVKYDSLKNYLAENNIVSLSLKEVRDAVLTIRSGKFEDPKKVGNAGSFFQNPIVSKTDFEKVLAKYPDIKYFEDGDLYKIFAGWLIEKAGWKGKLFKTAGVSPNHALILINPDRRAKAQDVYDLSEKIIADVKSKFNVKLVREVQLINF